VDRTTSVIYLDAGNHLQGRKAKISCVFQKALQAEKGPTKVALETGFSFEIDYTVVINLLER